MATYIYDGSNWTNPKLPSVPPGGTYFGGNVGYPVPGRKVRVSRFSASTLGTSSTLMSRPTGQGVYALEALNVNLDFNTGAAKVMTLAAAANGSRTLTLPPGTFEAQGFLSLLIIRGFFPRRTFGSWLWNLNRRFSDCSQ